MTMGAMEMMAGWDVFTSDGEKLGTVKEFTRDSLKIDAPMKPDFWLPMSSVVWTGVNRVELGFVKKELDDYKLDGVDVKV
jgi:hypothetical protein